MDALSDTSNWEYAESTSVARAIALRGLGDERAALAAALPVAAGGTEIVNEDRREAYVEAGLAALALGDESVVQRLVETVGGMPPARRSPLLRAGAARFEGLLSLRRGDRALAGERLQTAVTILRDIEAPFVLAQVLVECGELLVADERDDEAAPLLDEAMAIFERLGAAPWLERARTARTGVAA
jgi:hypothetical protein